MSSVAPRADYSKRRGKMKGIHTHNETHYCLCICDRESGYDDKGSYVHVADGGMCMTKKRIFV